MSTGLQESNVYFEQDFIFQFFSHLSVDLDHTQHDLQLKPSNTICNINILKKQKNKPLPNMEDK